VGTGDDTSYVAAPTRLQNLPKIVAASAGDRHALALTEEGEVMAWGANSTGQLGMEHTGESIPAACFGLWVMSRFVPS
jgi:alpha-tubulin suppressor-like RCC1 family protein